jgi:hypothetical protein
LNEFKSWLLDQQPDKPEFDHTAFSCNRARLLEHEITGEFFRARFLAPCRMRDCVQPLTAWPAFFRLAASLQNLLVNIAR